MIADGNQQSAINNLQSRRLSRDGRWRISGAWPYLFSWRSTAAVWAVWNRFATKTRKHERSRFVGFVVSCFRVLEEELQRQLHVERFSRTNSRRSPGITDRVSDPP